MDLVELQDVDDLVELGDVVDRIWGRTTPMVELGHLKAISDAGGYVVGARVDGDIVGGAVAFLGRSRDGSILLHSHLAGLLPEHRGRGRGRELKLHQRRWCLDRAIPTVEWTFDPLVRANGWFNLERLGAGIARYEVNCYGSLRDDVINGTDDSDRFHVVWELDDPRVVAVLSGDHELADEDALRGAGARDRIDAEGRLLDERPSTPVSLCLVPDDVIALRAHDPGAAARWRRSVREVMVSLLGSGGTIVGMTPSGRYVLEGPA